MDMAAWAPSGDVNVIVAYKAGSGTDTGARILASEAEKNIGRTLVINNLPGADGKIGWTQLVNAKPGRPDNRLYQPAHLHNPRQSSRILLSAWPMSCPLPTTFPKLALWRSRPTAPIKSLKDLVAACKEKPTMRASTNGVEASNHTAAQLLAKSAGFDYKAIPYGGTADQLLALRQVDYFNGAVVPGVPEK